MTTQLQKEIVARLLCDCKSKVNDAMEGLSYTGRTFAAVEDVKKAVEMAIREIASEIKAN